MKIYIPTYRRVGAQITWQSISPVWRMRTLLVAEPDEAEQLDMLGYPVLACPEKGIGPVRQWIIDQHKGDRLVMMDDDLGFYTRRWDSPEHFSQMRSHDEFDRMMDLFYRMMNQVAFGGIINRSGANRIPAPIKMNPRIHDLIGINVPIARKIGVRFDRVRFMEDFSVALQFLTNGYPTAALSTHCKGDRGSNSPGGCSEYRNLAGQAAAAKELHARYPDFVKLTTRPGWTGEMSEPRTDVLIRWQKAFASGKQVRDIFDIPQEPVPDWSGLGSGWELL